MTPPVSLTGGGGAAVVTVALVAAVVTVALVAAVVWAGSGWCEFSGDIIRKSLKTREVRGQAQRSSRALAVRLLAAVLEQRQPLDSLVSLDESSLTDSPAPGEGTIAELQENFGLMDARDRAFVRLLLVTALRHLGEIDWHLSQRLREPLKPRDSAAQQLLRLGLVQLLWLETPAHAAVDSTVTAAEELEVGHLKPLINGVLRTVVRQMESESPPPSPRWL